jgi:hypothetical protein
MSATPQTQPTSLQSLLAGEPEVVTVGVELFADALREQGVAVTPVEWRPPVSGTQQALATVVGDVRREEANATALQRMLTAGAELVDVQPADEALELAAGSFLHAGPPLTVDRASGPMLGALIGAVLFEGLEPDAAAAEQALRTGRTSQGVAITLDPCHHHRTVGPMAGVVSPSMWVFVLKDPVHGGTAFCSLNEGLGNVLRYGAYGPEVIERLQWMSRVLGPLLQVAVRRRVAGAGPIDIKAIVGQMLQMGDEGHNRNRAGTMMLVRELVPELLDLGAPSRDVADVVRFCNGNDHFFLNLVMPACKLALDAARDVPGSTLVVAMSRNGTDFGIQVSGTGSQWFTGPANTPQGLFLGAYGPQDANPDIGDSAITETGGIGGFAMAAAPAIVRFIGGEAADALATTRRMYEITLGEHPAYQVPVLGFRGTPTGIDVTAVVRTGILPVINTGMAGRVAGTGQVGAGLVSPPQECFTSALAALAARSASTRQAG